MTDRREGLTRWASLFTTPRLRQSLGRWGRTQEGEVLCRNRNVNSAAAVEPRILTFLKQPFINNLFTGAVE